MARAKKARSAKAGAPSRSKSRKGTKKIQSVEEGVSPIVEVAEISAPTLSIRTLALPSCMDSAAAGGLKAELLECRGQPLVVDAARVTRVGAQSLQILIAAARTWTADDVSYRVANPSTELLDVLALVGLGHEEMHLEGTVI